jgi:hypothetical protein
MGLISIGLFFWILPSIGVGWIATQKGRSGAGFFLLSLLISPVIAVLVLIALPVVAPRAHASSASGFVLCLNCRRPISNRAIECRFCKTNQASERRKIEMLESARLAASAKPDPADDTRPCPMCAETIKKAAVKCRFCQSTVEPVAG